MKKLLMLFVLCCIVIAGGVLYQQSTVQSVYNGLPTVPCIDTTQPIRQSFTFQLSITIDGKPYPLDKTIGHDYGKCLHDIFLKDSSGTVYVQTNGNETFVLGDFFNVWHQTYNKNQIFTYQTGNAHTIRVFVNGQEVETYEKTPIAPHETIEIVYQ